MSKPQATGRIKRKCLSSASCEDTHRTRRLPPQQEAVTSQPHSILRKTNGSGAGPTSRQGNKPWRGDGARNRGAGSSYGICCDAEDNLLPQPPQPAECPAHLGSHLNWGFHGVSFSERGCPFQVEHCGVPTLPQASGLTPRCCPGLSLTPGSQGTWWAAP